MSYTGGLPVSFTTLLRIPDRQKCVRSSSRGLQLLPLNGNAAGPGDDVRPEIGFYLSPDAVPVSDGTMQRICGGTLNSSCPKGSAVCGGRRVVFIVLQDQRYWRDFLCF